MSTTKSTQQTKSTNFWRFSVAPMAGITDRHCRYFHRQFTKKATLFTEMRTAPAIIHGDRKRIMAFSPEEHPLVLQVGGSDPIQLAECAKIITQYGYDGIDLNCGCPSSRVQAGSFGAILMLHPNLAAECIQAMKRVTNLPISLKCRTGVDNQNISQTLPKFLATIIEAGVDSITIHARKALLSGMSPKTNRTAPPLDYQLVYKMKRLFPNTHMAINGNIMTLAEGINRHLAIMDGIMLGRASYKHPPLLFEVDEEIYGVPNKTASIRIIAENMLEYGQRHEKTGGKLSHVTRHLSNLVRYLPGANALRAALVTGNISTATTEHLLSALQEYGKTVNHPTQKSLRATLNAAIST